MVAFEKKSSVNLARDQFGTFSLDLDRNGLEWVT